MENLILTKESSEGQIKSYFNAILKLKESKELFPVNIDDVWALVYSRRDKALTTLRDNFIEGEDYHFHQMGKVLRNSDLQNGIKIDATLSLSCTEYFIARKVRSVFEIYRKVFHKVTEQAALLPDFTNPAESARAWAEQYEAKAIAEKQAEASKKLLEQQEPLVQFANTLLEYDEDISIGSMAQIISQQIMPMGRTRLFEYLRKNGYLKSQGLDRNLPTQKSIDLKIMAIVSGSHKERGFEVSNAKAVVTAEGQKYFIDHFYKLTGNN